MAAHGTGHARAAAAQTGVVQISLQACWDADRLDLGRVGITPKPHRLCTEAARDLIPWSHARAIADFEPTEVLRAWGIG